MSRSLNEYFHEYLVWEDFWCDLARRVASMPGEEKPIMEVSQPDIDLQGGRQTIFPVNTVSLPTGGGLCLEILFNKTL